MPPCLYRFNNCDTPVAGDQFLQAISPLDQREDVNWNLRATDTLHRSVPDKSCLSAFS